MNKKARFFSSCQWIASSLQCILYMSWLSEMAERKKGEEQRGVKTCPSSLRVGFVSSQFFPRSTDPASELSIFFKKTCTHEMRNSELHCWWKTTWEKINSIGSECIVFVALCKGSHRLCQILQIPQYNSLWSTI